MPLNQYLPIANSPTANTLTAAQWAALSTLLQQGFSSGEVLSPQFNTFLRQLSVPVAAIAQFIADNQAQDVLDDGSVANFEAKFEAALLSFIEREGIAFASDGGTPDALTATPSPALTAYKTGQVIAVQKNVSVASNQTATPTINLNSLGAVTIVKGSGSPLYAGDLIQGGLFFAVFDGTYFRHLGPTLSTIDLRDQAGQAVVFASSGTNAYTGTLTPAPTALTPRMETLGFFASPNTSAAAPTLLLNGLGSALPILKQGGSVPSAGDIAGILPLVLNSAGTAWVVNGLVPSDVLALITANASVIRVTDAAGASTAQALVGTASPAISAYAQNQAFIVTAAAAITAANPTLNVTGAGGVALGALPIVRPDGSALVASPTPDIAAGAEFMVALDGAGAKFRFLGQLPSVAVAAVNAAKTIVIFGPGSTTWTPPAGITKVRARGRGAAGGGGGSAGGSGYSGGSGSGGSYFDGVYTVVPLMPIPITVGTGGVNGNSSGSAGGAGGATSFGSFATAPGGLGAYGSGGPSVNAAPAPAPANATGGQINVAGLQGGPGQISGVGGTGGGSYGQSAGNIPAIGSGGGISGQLPGVGGNGGGGNGYAGGYGGNGELILEF